MVGNGEIRDKVAYMRIGDRVDSDHQLMEGTLMGRGQKERGEKNERKIWRVVWDREWRVMCRERLRRVVMEGKQLEMEREEMEDRIKDALKEVVKVRAGRGREEGVGGMESVSKRRGK